MTNEEIKQNAEAYANKKAEKVANFQRNPVVEDFIAGAHSRDEEIEELQEELESLQEQYDSLLDGFSKRGTKLGELMKENVKLRNPWISVKDRLPKGEEVLTFKIVCTSNGVNIARYDESDGLWKEFGKGAKINVTHWMPIPKLPKGGEVC